MPFVPHPAVPLEERPMKRLAKAGLAGAMALILAVTGALPLSPSTPHRAEAFGPFDVVEFDINPAFMTRSPIRRPHRVVRAG